MAISYVLYAIGLSVVAALVRLPSVVGDYEVNDGVAFITYHATRILRPDACHGLRVL